jgi:two-component system, cell cycle response regulator
MSLIFIVDDSVLSRNSLSRLLEAEGHQVICLAESVGAADMIEEAKPDLLLLDVVMPKISGIELLADLKKREAMTTMPVIMVTAMTEAENLRQALDAGAFDYVRKPFDPVEVLARLRSALRTHDYMERLLYLAERDGLTGLLNHATILRELELSLSSLSAPGSCLSVVMCDIDFFKRVNDDYGHQAGDAVLSGLGELIAGSLGATGRAGRYGGEEFLIVLGGFDPAMAKRWAETFRAHVESREWEASGRRLKFTMSFGISYREAGQGLAEGASSSRELLAEADGRLYAAKKAGRNRVVASDEPVSGT